MITRLDNAYTIELTGDKSRTRWMIEQTEGGVVDVYQMNPRHGVWERYGITLSLSATENLITALSTILALESRRNQTE